MNELATTPPQAYDVVEILHRDERKALFRAVRCADGRPVLLKVLDPRRCREKDLEQLLGRTRFSWTRCCSVQGDHDEEREADEERNAG